MFRFSPPSGISQIRTCRRDREPGLGGQDREKSLMASPLVRDSLGEEPPG